MKKILIVLSICVLLVGMSTVSALFTLKIASQPNLGISQMNVANEKFCVDDLLVKKGGYRVDWSYNLNLIVFDQQEADGYYDIYTMNPDGTGEQCLTDNPNIPGGHTWPGGKKTKSEEDYLGVGTGPINQDISAMKLIWEFFEQHPMK